MIRMVSYLNKYLKNGTVFLYENGKISKKVYRNGEIYLFGKNGKCTINIGINGVIWLCNDHMKCEKAIFPDGTIIDKI